MNGRSSRRVLLAASLAVTGATVAFAQDAPAPAASAAPAAPAPSAAPATSAAAPAAAPASSAAAAPASSAPAPAPGNVTGYAYSTKSTKSAPAPATTTTTGAARHRGRLTHHADEAVATFPGFEMLADGGSRLFVQLSRQVDVDQQKDAGRAATPARKGKRAKAAVSAAGPTLTFTLKGTEVVRRNNENALVTVHFNTPVVRARLLPAGKDLRFVIELRADVAPQMKVVPAKDNGAMLQIDFPQGSYLPAQPAAPDTSPDGASDKADSN